MSEPLRERRMNKYALYIAAMALVFTACDGDDAGTPNPTDGDATVGEDRGTGVRTDTGMGGQGGDAGEGGEAGEAGTAGDGGSAGEGGEAGSGGEGGTAGIGGDAGSGGDAGAAGIGGEGGTGGGGGAAGAGGMTAVDSCESACGRYDACGKTAEVFGTLDNCLNTCERLTRDGNESVEGWWNCAESEACNLLHLCPVPVVEALGCGEVCELVEGCEVELNFNDCQATCEAAGAPFQNCADHLYGGVCDSAGFETCLTREVFSDCNDFCTSTVGCNVVAAEGCRRDCLTNYVDGDPLRLASQRRLNQCVRGAGNDCAVMDACVQPLTVGPPENLPTQEAFCQVFDGCDFFFEECDMAWNSYVQAGPDVVMCVYDALRLACPDGLFEIEQGCSRATENRLRRECTLYCSAQAACGEDELNNQDCINACVEGFGNDPDLNERLTSETSCIAAENCPDFNTCLDLASPRGQCERQCASLAACGDVSPDCVDECDAVWPRDRYALYRECIAAADGNCDAVNACTVQPGIPCEAACARLAECGNAAPNCVNVCDDLHIREPINMTLTVGCILAADECDPAPDILSVRECVENPEAAGRACLNFCRARTECNPAADLSECLTRCVSGFGDEDGLYFSAAEECLDNQAVDADCAVLEACIPGELDVDCDGYCSVLEGCRIERAECEATCNAEPDLATIGCTLDAVRSGQQCAGVAQCEGIQQPEISEVCSEHCATRKDCDRTVDVYLCEDDCTPVPPALAYQNACMAVSGCNFDECLELDDTPLEGCNAACGTALACQVFEDLNTCLATCTGQASSPTAPEDLLDRLNQCLGDARTPAGCDQAVAADCFRPAFCEAVPDVIYAPPGGGRINFDTTGAPSAGPSDCGGGGPQQVIVVSLGQRSNVSFEIVERSFDTLIHLRSACDDADSEIACNDDGSRNDFLASRIPDNEGTIALEAGIYYLYIDSFGGNGSGPGAVQITINGN